MSLNATQQNGERCIKGGILLLLLENRMDYDQLIDSWVNGNREDVAREVIKMTKAETIVFVSLFVKTFIDIERQREVDWLERLVERFSTV